MTLYIYKGFDKAFLEQLSCDPLVGGDISSKIDILSFSQNTRKTLEKELLDLEEDDKVWNNLYPDYYPIEFDLPESLAIEIHQKLDGGDSMEISDECSQFLTIYNALVRIEDKYYGGFFNYEFDKSDKITINNYYPCGKLRDANEETELQIFLNEDVETYLRSLSNVKTLL